MKIYKSKNRKIYAILVSMFILSLLFGFNSLIYNENTDIILRVSAVEIGVTDIPTAIDFYCGKLGFKIDEQSPSKVKLFSNDISLFLNKVAHQHTVQYNEESQTILVLQTNNLDSAVQVYRNKEIEIVEGKTENGVGYSIKFMDPFSNVISLLEQSKFPTDKFTEPKIYNVGYYVPDLDQAKNFYCDQLNFIVRTTKYLPALPLNHPDSTFAFMLHERDVMSTTLTLEDTKVVIVFSTTELNQFIKKLNNYSIQIITNDLKIDNVIFIKDPFGNIIKIVQL
ncbi:MAG: VOC family protein, partial [Ignavibacteria bacterium]